jgi:hypothetical protein
VGVLHAEVTQAADALDRDQVTRAGAGVPEGVERRDAGTEQGRGRDRVEVGRDGGQRFGRENGVLGVPPVEGDAGYLAVLAALEVAAPAGLAREAVTAVPAGAGAVALAPGGDALADGVDAAGDLVARDPGVADAGVGALLDVVVAVADAAGVDRDTDLPGAGVGDRPLDQFELGARLGDLHRAHGVGHAGRLRDGAVSMLASR